jgi:hypothetical protein
MRKERAGCAHPNQLECCFGARASTAIDHATHVELCRVAFDAITKSFSHQIIDPVPGYLYQLSWPRPVSARRRHGHAEREAQACG